MSNCQAICKLCDRLIISASVSVVTVSGVDTLVIDIPSRTYANGEKYCIVVAQAIPETATILMPVAISIGGVTDIVYPLTKRDGTQVTASGVHTRTKYSTKVITGVTSGVFRLICDVDCYPATTLSSLPVREAIVSEIVNDFQKSILSPIVGIFGGLSRNSKNEARAEETAAESQEKKDAGKEEKV